MNKIVILLAILIAFPLNSDQIDEDKGRWKPMYQDVTPKKMVSKWLVPFNTKDRTDLKTIRLVSSFAAKRNSYIRGHFHTGTDMNPRKKQKFNYVYPMAEGSVCSIHLGDPHMTIVIKHIRKDSSIIYTSYKHLAEIYVDVGDFVEHNTSLARLYTRKEARKQGGNYDHLHLEVRKKFDDFGCASWATMTRKELKLRFLDPWKFLKKNL